MISLSNSNLPTTTKDMRSSRFFQNAVPILFSLLIILPGCEKENSFNKEEDLFFGTVWKLDKSEYYHNGTLVKTVELGSDRAYYVHYFTDEALVMSVENGRHDRFVQTYTISDLHINRGANIPEEVVTSINQTSMVIETDGLQHAIYPELFDYDHSVSYYSPVSQSPLSSSFIGEWNNYKMDLTRDGKVENTWELDIHIKYSKDGTVTYSTAESADEGHYLLIDDKVAFSKNFDSVMTVKIDGKEMTHESYNHMLGTTRNYFRKVK